MTEGFQNPNLQYVTVLARMWADGQVTPLAIEWDEKTTYKIEKVLEKSRAEVPQLPSQGSDKVCCMYTVLIGGKKTHLYYEPWPPSGVKYPGRWFVLRKGQEGEG